VPQDIRHIQPVEIREKFNRDVQPKLDGGQYRLIQVDSDPAPPKICNTHGAGTLSKLFDIREEVSGKFVASCHCYTHANGALIGRLDPKTLVEGDVLYRVLGKHAYIG
jgi:hypothetical protein